MNQRRPAGQDEIEAGIARLEGHLLLMHEQATARQEAEAFARLLPWLTTAQHEDVVRVHRERHLALRRQSWRHTARRAEQLRDEYRTRYEELRRRLLCGYVALCLGVIALGMACAGLMALLGDE